MFEDKRKEHVQTFQMYYKGAKSSFICCISHTGNPDFKMSSQYNPQKKPKHQPNIFPSKKE